MRDDQTIDLFEARAARDEALKLVTEHSGSWFEQALNFIGALRDWRGTGEDLRLVVTEALGPPHHHNVWGALIAQAIKRSHLRKTGERGQMKTAKSHARDTPIYSSRLL